MKTSIDDFQKRFYIPSIKNLVFHLPHVIILRTHHCDNERRDEFDNCGPFKYV